MKIPRSIPALVVAAIAVASCMTSLKPAAHPASAAPSGTGHTVVAIEGTRFLINGERTSPGKPAEGQLLNTRMAQAIFDDENPATVGFWAYPDTHTWDPQRNTDEFVAMLPTYAQHGIRLVTVGLQGGCPAHGPHFCPGGDHPWIASAFNADGSLKPAWMNRLKQVITAADHNGIVVMVQFFYHGQNQRVLDQSAAVNHITDWLVSGGYRNVLVETANECNAGFQSYSDCPNEANVIKQVQTRSSGQLKVAVSFTGGGMPSDDVIKQEDFVLLHGNGLSTPQVIDLINALKNRPNYTANPKPIVINEDSTSIANMDAAVAAGVSWGYLDTGANNYQDGFQSPPVNWTLNTDAKKAFFAEALRLAGPTLTSLVYSGPSTADFNDELLMTATLADIWGNPLAGAALSFGLGAQTCSGVTGPTGQAACTLIPTGAAGNTSLMISYAGNDQFRGLTRTVPFVIAPEQTALAYHGDATLINGRAAQLSAALTEDGTMPLAGRVVAFTLGMGSGAQTCTGTTDQDGVAGCTLGGVAQPLGSGAVSATFGGDRFYAGATSTAAVQVNALQSGLSYTGPTSGDVDDSVSLSAQLLAGEEPVGSVAIVFSLGSQSCSGQTDAHGVASCSLVPTQNAATYPLSASFNGNDNFQPSSTSASFTVTKEETRLSYGGDTSLRNGAAASLNATLTEDGSIPLAGRSVSLTLGSGSSAQGCTATTDATGKAACSIASVNQPAGAGTVTASFAGDARLKPATDQPAIAVLTAANTGTTPTSTGTTLATTGRPNLFLALAARTILSLPLWGRVGVGAALVLLALLILHLPRRRRGEPPSIIWRNRE